MICPVPITAEVTVPVMRKLYGFSSLSLLLKLMSLVKLPILVVLSWIVNVSDPPGAIDGERPSTREKPVGRFTEPRLNVALPLLTTVKVRCTGAPPCATLPKSVPLLLLGEMSPSAILFAPHETAISGAAAAVTARATPEEGLLESLISEILFV